MNHRHMMMAMVRMVVDVVIMAMVTLNHDGIRFSTGDVESHQTGDGETEGKESFHRICRLIVVDEWVGCLEHEPETTIFQFRSLNTQTVFSKSQ